MNRLINISFRLSLVVLILTLVSACNSSQSQNNDDETQPERRKSPVVIAHVKHNDTYIKIVYGQPYKRGRVIFGNLVPYGKVWRTGANEATEMTVTQDIMFGGKKVKAGTYALFTIPHKDEWTVILNNDLGQWGAFEYNSDSDYLRFSVHSEKMDQTVEAFTMKFGEVEDNVTTLMLMWDQTEVSIPIRFLDT